ncbi:MAG TPA: histidine kinase [Bacteroidia bacterium]|nr:histidine kinase [Bacteroidia bacterium]
MIRSNGIFCITRLIVFINIFISSVQAQQKEIPSRHFSADDGLPSSEVHKIVEDSKGYIWIATDRGVSKFDGYEIKSFGIAEGLLDISILRLTLDSRGRVWMIGRSGNIYYEEEGKILPYKFTKTVVDFCQQAVPIDFQIDSNGTFYVSFTYSGVLAIDSSGHTKRIISYHDVTQQTRYLDLYEISPGKLMKSVSNFSTFSWENILCYTHNNVSDSVNFGPLANGKLCYCQYKGVLYVAVNNQFYVFESGKWKKEMPWNTDVILQLFADSSGLWIGTTDGAYFFRDSISLQPELHLLPKKSVSAIFKDNEGSFWFGTLEDGVYYYPHLGIERWSFPQAFSQSATAILSGKKNDLFVGLQGGQVVHIDQEKCTYIPTSDKFNNDNFIYALSNMPPDETVYVGSPFSGYIVNETFKSIPGKFTFTATEGIKTNDEGVMCSVGNSEIFKFQADRISVIGEVRGKCLCFDFIGKDKMIIGTLQGLRCLNINTGIVSDTLPEFKTIRIDDLQIRKDTMYLATKGYGIIILAKNFRLTINENNGLTSNLCNELLLDGNQIWCATNKGVSRIRFLNSLGRSPYSVEQITVDDGLQSNEVNAMTKSLGYLYVATKSGVSKLDTRNSFKNAIPPLNEIISFEVNNAKKNLHDKLVLDYTENNIRIRFNGLSFRSNKKIQYLYKLISDGDTLYSETSSRFAEFPVLLPGNYRFEVSAVNSSGLANSMPAAINFIVNPAWWNTLWFRIVVLFCIGIVSYVLYRFRLSRTKANYEMEIRQASLRLTALRAQMNPHFVFNVMDSIRHYMKENNSLEAEKYLTSFAKLVRYTLDQSDKQECSLEEELSMIRVYVELEKEQYSKDTTIEIICDPGLDISMIKIPTMILQPYVENAFKHGLKNKNQDGKIRIHVQDLNNYIQVCIEDNGGPVKNTERTTGFGRPVKSSLGRTLVQERILAYNKAYGKNVRCEIQSVLNEQGEQTGTKVYIVF